MADSVPSPAAARQSVAAHHRHRIGMRPAHALLSPPRLALLALTLFAPFYTLALPQPTNQLYFVCKKYPTSKCTSWIIRPEDVADIITISNKNKILKRYCHVSNFIPTIPHPHYPKVNSLNSKDSTKINLCKTLVMKKEFDLKNIVKFVAEVHRTRRQSPYSPRGRYRGQTQSQYLAIDHGNEKDEGKAEAHSDADSSRATVSGSSGMGQAQSQSMYDPSCDECYGRSDSEIGSLRRKPTGPPQDTGNGYNYLRPNQGGTPKYNGVPGSDHGGMPGVPVIASNRNGYSDNGVGSDRSIQSGLPGRSNQGTFPVGHPGQGLDLGGIHDGSSGRPNQGNVPNGHTGQGSNLGGIPDVNQGRPNLDTVPGRHVTQGSNVNELPSSSPGRSSQGSFPGRNMDQGSNLGIPDSRTNQGRIPGEHMSNVGRTPIYSPNIEQGVVTSGESPQAGMPGVHTGQQPNQGLIPVANERFPPTQSVQGVPISGTMQVPTSIDKAALPPIQAGLPNQGVPSPAGSNGINWPFFTGSFPGGNGATYFCCVVSPNNYPQYLGSGQMFGTDQKNYPGGTNIPNGSVHPGGQYVNVPGGSNIAGGGAIQPGGQYGAVPGGGVQAGGQYGTGQGGLNVPGGVIQPGGQYGTTLGGSNIPGSSLQPWQQYGPGSSGLNVPGGGVPLGPYGTGTGGFNIPGGIQQGGQYGTGPGGSNIPGGGIQPGGQYGTGPGGPNIPGGGIQPGGQYGIGPGGPNVPGSGVQPGGQYATGPGGSNVPGSGVQPGGQYATGPGGSNVPGSGVQPGGQYATVPGGSNVPSSGLQPGGQYGTGPGGPNVPGSGVQPGGQYATGPGGSNVPGSGLQPGGQYGTGPGAPNVPGGPYGTGPGGSNVPGGGIQPGGQYGTGTGGPNVPGGGIQPGGQYGTGPGGPNVPGSGVQPGGQYGTTPGGSSAPGGGIQPGGQYGTGPGGLNVPGGGVLPGGQYSPGTGGTNVPGGGIQPGGQYGIAPGGSNIPGGGIQPGGQYGPGPGGSNLPGGGIQPGGQYGPGPVGTNVPGGGIQPGGQYVPGPGGSNIPGGSIQPGIQYGPGSGGLNVPSGGVPPGGQYGTLPGGVNVPGGGVSPGGQYGTGPGGLNVPGGGVPPGGQYGTGPGGSNLPSGGVQPGGQYGPGPGGTNVPGGGVQSGGQYGTGPGGLNVPGGGVPPGGQYGTGPGGSNIPGGGVQSGGQYGPGPGGTNVPGSGIQPGGQYGTVPGGSNIPGSGAQSGGQYGPGGGVQPGGSYGSGPGGSNMSGSGGSTIGQGGYKYDVPQNVIDPNSIAATIDDYDSEAEASVAQTANGTTASATSRGGNEKGHAQTNVHGTYTGSGSFSAQAAISDENKGAQSEVEGGKKGSKSSAQGRGRNNLSQATVHLGSETGSLQTTAESNGNNLHSSNSKVQGSVKGGMADSQARGPGGTSSQAQIGFTPYKEGDKSHELLSTPFVGKGTASAQSSGRTGQSQSNLQGTFKYGITYNGAAQAGASIDKDAVFPNRLPFNSIDVFDENNKNINVNTDTPPEVKPIPSNTATEKAETETMNNSESRYTSHTHSDHHKLDNSLHTSNAPVAPVSNRRSFHTNYDTTGSDYEYTTGKDDANADDYYPDSGFGPDGTDATEVDQSEYPNYEEYARDGDSTHQSLHSPSRKGFEIKQTTGGNTQHILLGSLATQDAEITQRNSERPDENRIYQPGERVPGTGGYTIPIGFTGSIKSVASKDKTYVVGSKNSPSQAQTVSLSPGTGKVKYVYPSTYGKNVNPKNLKSLYNSKLDNNNRYVSVSKSVTRDLDSENNIRKQYLHTYYTKSSSCGYFTFTCTMVSGVDGRKKVCKPKIPTNPDGSPIKC